MWSVSPSRSLLSLACRHLWKSGLDFSHMFVQQRSMEQMVDAPLPQAVDAIFERATEQIGNACKSLAAVDIMKRAMERTSTSPRQVLEEVVELVPWRIQHKFLREYHFLLQSEGQHLLPRPLQGSHRPNEPREARGGTREAHRLNLTCAKENQRAAAATVLPASSVTG